MNVPKIDRTGQRYGRLTVLSEAPKRGKNGRWNCICDCGTRTVVYGGHLQQGVQISCGCYNAEKRWKHGHSRTPEYRAWAAMIQRCENPNNPKYPDYGGRGISVCASWHVFDNFHADMGDSNGLTLDRIDNGGNYQPENCRWTTYTKQNRNHRRNRLLTFNGETLTQTEWASRLGIHPVTLYYRITKSGWSIEKALTTPKEH